MLYSALGFNLNSKSLAVTDGSYLSEMVLILCVLAIKIHSIPFVPALPTLLNSDALSKTSVHLSPCWEGLSLNVLFRWKGMCCWLCMARSNPGREQNKVAGKGEAGEGDPGQGLNQKLKLDKESPCPEEPQVQRSKLKYNYTNSFTTWEGKFWGMVCFFAIVAITEHHRFGNPDIYFLTFLEAKSWRSRYWQVWFPWGLPPWLAADCPLIATHVVFPLCVQISGVSLSRFSLLVKTWVTLG